MAELSSVAEWARINRLDAKDRSVLMKDKYRYMVYSIEDTAVDIQALSDELQLSKTAVVSRLVALAAREACMALGLDELGAPLFDDYGPDNEEVMRYEISKVDAARYRLLKMKDADEVTE